MQSDAWSFDGVLLLYDLLQVMESDTEVWTESCSHYDGFVALKL